MKRGFIWTPIDTLAELAGADASPLAMMLDDAIDETRAIVTRRAAAADQAHAAAGVADQLRRIEAQVAELSDALGRQYFALLALMWAESLGQQSGRGFHVAQCDATLTGTGGNVTSTAAF